MPGFGPLYAEKSESCQCAGRDGFQAAGFIACRSCQVRE
jgi:hypothetical protein